MTFPDEEKLSTHRVQTGFLFNAEKKALLWMAPQLPRWISPDIRFSGCVRPHRSME